MLNLLPDMPLRDRNGRKQGVIRHRTVDELTAALQLSIDTPERHGSSISDGSWSGTDTAAEYVRMLRDGWPEGVQGVEGLDGLSTDRAERLTFHRNVGGVFPVVPAYLAGAPDAMLDVRPTPVDNVRSVTLIVDSSFNSGVSSETALEYARSAMRLVAWLAAEQIDAAVYMSVSVALRGTRALYLVPVRQCGDVLMPERLAALIHPAFLRRAWFALLETELHDHKLKGAECAGGGYGSARNASADEVRQALPDAQSVIMLPKVGSGDPQAAVEEALSVKLKTD